MNTSTAARTTTAPTPFGDFVFTQVSENVVLVHSAALVRVRGSYVGISLALTRNTLWHARNDQVTIDAAWDELFLSTSEGEDLDLAIVDAARDAWCAIMLDLHAYSGVVHFDAWGAVLDMNARASNVAAFIATL